MQIAICRRKPHREMANPTKPSYYRGPQILRRTSIANKEKIGLESFLDRFCYLPYRATPALLLSFQQKLHIGDRPFLLDEEFSQST